MLAEIALPRPQLDRAAAAVPVDARYRRAVPWGPWSLSDIKREGLVIGWGANCNQHRDPDNDLACKKSITFGDAGLTSEQCQAKLKHWLLIGETIEDDHPRAAHIKIDARPLEVFSIAELDEMLRAHGHEP